MTDTQWERIEAHGRNLLALFPQAEEQDPMALCKRLRRLERKGAALASRQCDESTYLADEEWEAAKDAILAKVDELLDFTAAGVPVFFNTDPRGYALKVREEYMRARPGLALHRDWGGYGIIAPEIEAS